MDKSLLVRVFTPLRSKPGEAPGSVGECGTAYPVGPDLILTARHVVFPEDRDPDHPIEVLWHSYPDAGPANGWYPLGNGAIVWDCKDLDAALLRCGRPEKARGFGFVSGDRPATGDKWESAGFPRVAKYLKGQESESFLGEMHSMAIGSAQFSIDVASAPPKQADWSGASGMPICRQGSQVILGLAKQCPPGLAGAKLHATPAFKLLESEEFRCAIGYDAQISRKNAVRMDLTKILTASSQAVDAIVDHSRLCPDRPAASPDRPAAVAAQLLGHDCPAAVAGLHRAHAAVSRQMRSDDTPELREAMDVIADAAQLLAPYLYDPGVIGAFRSRMGRADLEFWTVPCVLPTVAEIIMAGVDGRPTTYLPRDSDTHYPEGRTAVAASPETGIAGWDAKAKAVRDAISQKLNPGAWSPEEWHATRIQIDDFMYLRFVGSSAGAPRDQAQRVRAAAVELQASTVDAGQSYYLFIPLPKEAHLRHDAEAELNALRRDFPDLFVLGYEDDGDQETRDRATFSSFQRILPKRS